MEPTSGLEPLTLAPATSDNSGVAGVCSGLQSRISKRLSLLRVAACCTVLRSRWYQNGIKTSDSYTLTVGPMACPRALHRHSSGRGGCSLRSLHALNPLKFARQIRCLPLLPVRRRQPHLGSSLGPCETPPPRLPRPCLS